MAGRTGSISTRAPADLLLDAFSSGALGGSAVALFFLVVDLMDGRPLFTPSLLGSVLFHGIPAEDVATVRADAVAYYSIVHVLGFAALGAAITWLVHEVELHSRHPVLMLLTFFAILEVAFLAVAPLVLSGVIARLGTVRVGAANLLAAVTMALYFLLSHRAKAWRRLEHSRADLGFDAFYSGALGASVVALFFLIVDVMDGHPLFTPSLLGRVFFDGVAAEDVAKVQLDAVAYYTPVHIAAFLALGAASAWLVHEAELHSRHPVVVLLVLFAILEVGFFLVAPLALSGVVARLGIVRIALANLLAAGMMALFFLLSHRARAWPHLRHAGGDLLFDSFYSGAIGGSAVALFFLVVDVLDGQPLFTPSLMGGVLFHGDAAEEVTKVRLDAVAYFSVVHIVAFGAVGILISWLVHGVELRSRHPLVVLLVLFVTLEASFFAAASVAMPGVITRVGIPRLGGANLLAAGTITLFFVWSHNEEAWQRLKHVAHLVPASTRGAAPRGG
jgi:hypothetical protein